MNWKTLDKIEQLEEIKQNSFEKNTIDFQTQHALYYQ